MLILPRDQDATKIKRVGVRQSDWLIFTGCARCRCWNLVVTNKFVPRRLIADEHVMESSVAGDSFIPVRIVASFIGIHLRVVGVHTLACSRTRGVKRAFRPKD